MIDKKHLPEEVIVDYLLGHVEDNQRGAVQGHIQDCNKCAQKLNEWEILLHQEAPVEFASDKVKARVWDSIEKENDRKRKRWSWLRKPTFTFAAIAAVITLIVIVFRDFQEPMPLSNYEFKENDNIPVETMEEKRYTNQIAIMPVAQFQNLDGRVWVNEHTNEMLLELSGLYRLPNHDYQLWIIYTDDQMDYEIIPVQNGSTRMFFQGIPIEEFKRVKGSVEPLGGSEKQTGPDTFYIEF